MRRKRRNGFESVGVDVDIIAFTAKKRRLRALSRPGCAVSESLRQKETGKPIVNTGRCLHP
jgi:hypothetical protein